jgi:hypothetical protein
MRRQRFAPPIGYNGAHEAAILAGDAAGLRDGAENDLVRDAAGDRITTWARETLVRAYLASVLTQ